MLKGYLDRVVFNPTEGLVLHGWAVDTANVDNSFDVEVLVGDSVVAVGRADIERGDLVDSGFGNGRHGFSLRLPLDSVDATSHVEPALRRAADKAIICGPSRFRVEPVVGWLDKVEGIVVFGWALNASDPSRPVAVDIFLDGLYVGHVLADQYREDLLATGTGYYGFQWLLPEVYADGVARTLSARVSNQNTALSGEFVVRISYDRLNQEAKRIAFLLRAALKHAQDLQHRLFAEARTLRLDDSVSITDLLLDRIEAPTCPDDAEDFIVVSPPVGTRA